MVTIIDYTNKEELEKVIKVFEGLLHSAYKSVRGTLLASNEKAFEHKKLRVYKQVIAFKTQIEDFINESSVYIVESFNIELEIVKSIHLAQTEANRIIDAFNVILKFLANMEFDIVEI